MASSQKLGNYPSFLIIASLSTALFIAGFCGWLTLSSRSLIKNMKQNVEIQAYLDKELDDLKIDSIKAVIAKKPYIVKNNKDFEYNFISKDRAAERFKNDTNEDYTSILGDNPFRDAMSIKINEKYFEEAKLKEIELDLETINGVFDADFPRNFIESINANISKIYFILITFVFLMLLGILFLVNNTIRLALFSQRFIIRSMQLVGATDSFIRKPFLLKGTLQGGIAGVIAMLVLLIIQQLGIQQIDGFALIQNSSEFIILAVVIILIGCFMGFASTYLALSRYLKLDLDELF